MYGPLEEELQKGTKSAGKHIPINRVKVGRLDIHSHFLLGDAHLLRRDGVIFKVYPPCSTYTYGIMRCYIVLFPKGSNLTSSSVNEER